MFAPQLSDRRLTYLLAPVDNAVRIVADPDKLQQILLNLVSNAVKFTPAAGRITVSTRVSDNVVEVLVTDTGRGIPADKLETVFEPFVQLSRVGEVSQGTGLGLSISRDLARGMGGDLRAESDGNGSTFVLTLTGAPT